MFALRKLSSTFALKSSTRKFSSNADFKILGVQQIAVGGLKKDVSGSDFLHV